MLFQFTDMMNLVTRLFIGFYSSFLKFDPVKAQVLKTLKANFRCPLQRCH